MEEYLTLLNFPEWMKHSKFYEQRLCDMTENKTHDVLMNSLCEALPLKNFRRIETVLSDDKEHIVDNIIDVVLICIELNYCKHGTQFIPDFLIYEIFCYKDPSLKEQVFHRLSKRREIAIPKVKDLYDNARLLLTHYLFNSSAMIDNKFVILRLDNTRRKADISEIQALQSVYKLYIQTTTNGVSIGSDDFSIFITCDKNELEHLGRIIENRITTEYRGQHLSFSSNNNDLYLSVTFNLSDRSKFTLKFNKYNSVYFLECLNIKPHTIDIFELKSHPRNLKN